MRCLTVGQAFTCVVLSLSSLLSVTSAWPTFNLHNSQFAKRQGPSDTPPQGGVDNEPAFNEEYDFIIAGGMFQFSSPHSIHNHNALLSEPISNLALLCLNRR